MTVRQSLLASPARVVWAAVVVILLFALAYPFAGGVTEVGSETGASITYALDPSELFETGYAAIVLLKSLDFSVQMFTLVGSPDTRAFGVARYLASLESMLGMGFVALFTASLVREE